MMEDRTSTQAADGDHALSANPSPEPEDNAKAALVPENSENDKTVVKCEDNSSHSTALAGDTPSPVQLMEDGGKSCHVCKKVYKNKSSLTTHLRVKHKEMTSNIRSKMPCLEEGCEYRANRIARLITHLIQEHKMKFQCEKVTFQKKEDFWKWRKEAEDRCRSSYCAETSSKKMVSGDMKFFLRCRRSGYFKCQSTRGPFPQGIRKGSVKINAVCTSFMEVTFATEGSATVHFCRTHYGHADDGRHLRMNVEERNAIRQLIMEGEIPATIIATMKAKMPQHRHQLLTYNSIRGIAIRLSIQAQERSLAYCYQDQKASPRAIRSKADQNSLTLQVEKEVEARDRQSPDTPGNLDHIQVSSLGRLKAEVKTKIEKVFQLASTATSEDTLKYVGENLDFLTDLMESSSKNIEVISDPSEPAEDTGRNVVLHKDIDGNTHMLLCSSESIDELMCIKEEAP